MNHLLTKIPPSKLYLIIIAVFLIIVLAFLLYSIFTSKKPKTPVKPVLTITSQDIKAISGDNVLSTQLDLARAYMEMGKKQLAKKILNHVIEHGTTHQQQEAHQLITVLETV